MKIVYFDVENYEEEFLKENNGGKYTYFLEQNPLNDLSPIKKEYEDADIISVLQLQELTKKFLNSLKILN